MSFFHNRLTLIAGLVLLVAPAAAFAQNCTITLPPNPLSAMGLSSVYTVTGTTGGDTCAQESGSSTVFVQAAILDNDPQSATYGSTYIYNPLIVDAGTTPGAPPVAVSLPGRPGYAVVALWFGADAGTITLQGTVPPPPPPASPSTINNVPTDPLTANGCTKTPLGQFAYCNAPAFFTAVHALIPSVIKVPALGTGADGQVCPTSRSFSIVDQDQSDNQTTWYLLLLNGTLAQYNAANVVANPLSTSTPPAAPNGSVVIQNPSDEWLVSEFVDKALGCTPWKWPDLTDAGNLVPSMAANEIQAAIYQKAPIALVPLGDPFAMDYTVNPPVTSLTNVNLYRAGVDQVQALNNAQASTATYCTNLRNIGAQKLLTDSKIFKAAASPLPVGDSLYTTLGGRMMASYQLLNCQALINQPDPITAVTDPVSGLITSITIKATSSGAQ